MWFQFENGEKKRHEENVYGQNGILYDILVLLLAKLIASPAFVCANTKQQQQQFVFPVYPY